MSAARKRGDTVCNGRTWRRIAIVGAAALLAHLAWLVVPAGASERSYDSTISPFNGPGSASFDAQGNVWVTDGGQFKVTPGHQGIYLRSPYPSQTVLAEPNTNVPWGPGIISLQGAVNTATGELFVAQSSGRTVAIFDGQGNYLRSWTAINGIYGFGETGSIHVAVDNTDTDSGGRVYLALSKPENDVEAFDDAQRPVDFPGTAGYINENRITGTPEGPFGEAHFVSTDDQGNIYVTDTTKNLVDVFRSTGSSCAASRLPKPHRISSAAQVSAASLWTRRTVTF